MMKSKMRPLLTASVLGFVMAATGAIANQGDETTSKKDDVGAAAHINLSGKLRMLSQRVPAAACQAAAGIGTEYATKVLKGATAEFAKIVDALEFGDAELGMPYPEERRLTLGAIADVRAAWVPVYELSGAVLDGSVTDGDFDKVQDNSGALLKAAKKLVVEEVGEYSNPAEMQAAESFLIDIAGRQRMLIQMMSKTACLKMTDHSVDSVTKSLGATMNTFEATLTALIGGMPSVGIRRPPTDEISAGLKEVEAQWITLKPFLTEVLEGKKMDTDTAAEKFRAMNEMMAQMNKVVGMYSDAV